MKIISTKSTPQSLLFFLISILLLSSFISCRTKSNYENSNIYEIDKKLIPLENNLKQTRKDYKKIGGDSIYNKIREIMFEIEFYENKKKNIFKEL